MQSNRCRVGHSAPRPTIYGVRKQALLKPVRDAEVFRIVVSPEYLAQVQTLYADKRPRVALRAR
jgi:hypothetical protein